MEGKEKKIIEDYDHKFWIWNFNAESRSFHRT